MNIWLIVLFLLIGFFAGYFEVIASRISGIASLMTKAGLIILLAAMGAKIGVDDRIYTRLDQIGFQSFLLALGSVVGSIILVKLASKGLSAKIQLPGETQTEVDEINVPAKTDLTSDELTEEITEKGENWTMTLTIVISVIGGILAGFLLIPHSFFKFLDPITTYALAALLLGVGVDIGQNKGIFLQVRRLGWKIMIIPLLVVVGSISGSIITGAMIGLAGNEAAAVGAGFGWYSLSGILLAKIYSVELGSLAFLANVFRELLTILSLPLVVKYLGKITAIAPGGATTMDVTLPVIKEAAGEEVVIPAFINGVVLSTLVPILVPFLVRL